MKPSINEVERELRRLPREGASDGFTKRVLREALEPKPQRRAGWLPRWDLLVRGQGPRRAGVPRWVVVLASVALAMVLGATFSELRRDRAAEPSGLAAPEQMAANTPLGLELRPDLEPVRLHDFVESHRRATESQHRATLESEYLALQTELERLRRLQAVRDSVIVVPGAGEFDYYIDLRPVLTSQAAGYQPASMPITNRPR